MYFYLLIVSDMIMHKYAVPRENSLGEVARSGPEALIIWQVLRIFTPPPL